MKTLIFSILTIICIFALHSFTSIKDEEYKQKNYFDSKCNCYVRSDYYPNGNLFSFQQFTDSIDYIKNGVSIYYYENGDTADFTYYVNNEAQGYSYNKYQNGTIGIERYFTNNYLDSLIYYDENGLLENIIVYKKPRNENYEGNRIDKHFLKRNKIIYQEEYHAYNMVKMTVLDSVLYQQMQDSLANRTGKEIFIANCGACHHPTQDATGPKLEGIMERRNEKWVTMWIKNSAKMIAKGDKYAVAIYNKWNNTAMPAFPNISPKDMNKLIDYLKTL